MDIVSAQVKSGMSMAPKGDFEDERAEASAILKLNEADVSALFYREAMRRNLSKTVRRLDRLVKNGGEDRILGKSALKRLGFDAER